MQVVVHPAIEQQYGMVAAVVQYHVPDHAAQLGLHAESEVLAVAGEAASRRRFAPCVTGIRHVKKPPMQGGQVRLMRRHGTAGQQHRDGYGYFMGGSNEKAPHGAGLGVEGWLL